MMTLRRFAEPLTTIPAATGWYLADLGQAIGRQELFTRQSPQKLKALREHALVESAVSSNRIEGVTVDDKRVGTLVFGHSALRDRDEEEVRGYRDALDLIHSEKTNLPITETTLLHLHRLVRGEIWDAGKYKEKDGDIIEKYPDGSQRVRFRTLPAQSTPQAMKELLALWPDCLRERRIHPLVAMGGFNLDFLCIHPFRDGNGRVSRLLLLLQCYHLGIEVGRYISLERLIEQNKEDYYQTLEKSSAGWHEGRHDPWPYVNHLLFILKEAYKELERRVGDTAEPRGAKGGMVRECIAEIKGQFTLRELERKCPAVSRDMIRRVLRDMAKEGLVKCVGRGPDAKWKKLNTA